ncbi:histidinol-phosphate transaminase [Sporosarcina sp. HYO08]|uniref:histidinol-phosphate transaminase n=1 Tax=Sporosarcina sp. HYO08 TaxID=1759557 RepID=UPI000794905D|nr:histidinol-phosphate transaminase [Sporosarcina sp. HYO08]KXH82018.1 histidinol-phosphate aminotransferase [Sporosarcina sp. HYO08]
MKWVKALQEITPYKPGRSIEDVIQHYGLKEVVKLASNENPYGCAPSVQEWINSASIHTEIYPDGFAASLRGKLAEKHGVDEGAILFGNGSDEIVTIISRALLGPDTNTVMAATTFPQYAHNAKIEGAEIREIPLTDNGQHDLDGFLQAIDEQTAVVWICNPNNPTGNLIPSDDLKSFLEKVPSDVLVVLDEAYFEYITDPGHVDSMTWLNQFSNISILRTFSKAYGLAAYRIGYAISDPTIITELNKVRNPFNNNSFALSVAEKAIEDEAFIEQCRALNHQQRERFKQYAQEKNIRLYDSETNFVLMEVPNDTDVASEKLLHDGLIVRSGNALGIPGFVRITIGSEEQNDKLFQAFDRLWMEG